jgi:hypothetical protein
MESKKIKAEAKENNGFIRRFSSDCRILTPAKNCLTITIASSRF